MKERVVLSKAVAVGEDLAVSAFHPSYIYVFEDGIRVYFEPNLITPQHLLYAGPKIEESADSIVIPEDVSESLKAALSAVMQLCARRLETPFIPPTKDVEPAPAIPPVREATPADAGVRGEV